MKMLRSLLLGSTLALATTFANAAIVVLDDSNDANFEAGIGAYSGNPNAYGPSLTFSDFLVTGGYAASNVLTGSGFNISQITFTTVDHDYNPGHGGLGVCSENLDCSGSSDSFSSNTNDTGPGGDEILLFDFGSITELQTVFFNRDHAPLVDGDLVGSYKNTANALFNVFYSADGGTSYTSIFGSAGQQQPTDLDYFDVDSGFHQHWAVAATGWGKHSSYIEALTYDVPAPSTIGLMALALLGLRLSRNKFTA